MADVTIKSVDDFEAIFGGGLLRARSALGVSSFGMQVEEFPPNATEYPEHDHSEDGMEEVYTVLDGTVILQIDGQEYVLTPGT
ncbi:MAG: cupin domain-containing protein, partial [Actinobacteria bacterium]